MARRRLGSFGVVVTLASLVALAGCAFSLPRLPASERAVDTPDDVREEETGLLTGLFSREPADLPDAVPVPMRAAVLERGYGGVIIRATGVGPTQGFHGATLVPLNGGAPDAAGVVTVSLVAVPPTEAQAVGPERTRLLLTAAFVGNLELRGVRGFRVVAAGQSATLPL